MTAAGASDIFIAKYDVAGLLMWAKRAGGSGNDIGHGLAIDDSGNSYVTGSYEGSAIFGMGETNQTVLNSPGNSDIFVAVYNNDGILQRAQKAGGSRFDMGFGTAVGPSADIYVMGRFNESAIFGDGEPNETTLNSVGATDIFVAKFGVGSPTSVDEHSILIDDFNLAQNYPNPFNPATTIFFESPKAVQITLAIYNLRGQLIRTLVSGEVQSGQQYVVWDGTDNNGRDVGSGIYIYKLNAGKMPCSWFLGLHSLLGLVCFIVLVVPNRTSEPWR